MQHTQHRPRSPADGRSNTIRHRVLQITAIAACHPRADLVPLRNADQHAHQIARLARLACSQQLAAALAKRMRAMTD